MYKKLFVPIDGSSASKNALGEALAFAKSQKATVCLFHAYEGFKHTGPDGKVDLTQALKDEGQLLLDNAAAQAKTAGVKTETRLVDVKGHRTSRVLTKEAERWGADLILMGTHGRHGFERLVLGSVAEGVVRRSRLPVMLLPAGDGSD